MRKYLLLLFIPLALVIGISVWFMADGYTFRVWKQRIMNPSLEYVNYNANNGPQLTSDEITEHANAVKVVEAFPDVQEFFAALGPKQTTSKGCHRFIGVDHRLGDVYTVEVFDDCVLYTNVLAWYEVDRKTWGIVNSMSK